VILIPILTLIVGIIVGRLVLQPIGTELGTYMAVACIAGLDTVCGGIRSALENKYHTDIFITGFLSNILIAFFLAWLGDQIGINLFLASALILGGRIFVNLSLIRRILLSQWQDARERKRRQAQQSASQT
jgi:small basic protein